MLNAGAAIYAGGVADSLAAGIDAARAAIDSGAAQKTLDDYVGLSRSSRRRSRHCSTVVADDDSR